MPRPTGDFSWVPRNNTRGQKRRGTPWSKNCFYPYSAVALHTCSKVLYLHARLPPPCTTRIAASSLPRPRHLTIIHINNALAASLSILRRKNCPFCTLPHHQRSNSIPIIPKPIFFPPHGSTNKILHDPPPHLIHARHNKRASHRSGANALHFTCPGVACQLARFCLWACSGFRLLRNIRPR